MFQIEMMIFLMPKYLPTKILSNYNHLLIFSLYALLGSLLIGLHCKYIMYRSTMSKATEAILKPLPTQNTAH